MARVEALSMSGATAIPAEYVRPQEERQGLGDAYDEAAASWSAAGSPRIPVVDVAGFDAADPGSPASLAVVDAVRAAAEGWGVMHVAGHGIPEDLIDQLRGAGTGFFRMPIEDKEAYANDPAAGRLQGYGSRLAGSAGEDGKREWEDYLFHMLHPDARADHACWPAHPPEYVPVTKSFGEHVSALSSRLLAILSLGLGVPADTLERRLRLTSGGEAEAEEVEDDLLLKLKINYYPRCPLPELLADGAETPRFEPRTFRQHLERKVLKKNNYQKDEEAKKPPVAAQEDKLEAMKPLVAGEEKAAKPPVAGEEEHKVVKKEQSEHEEAKIGKAPVAANLVEVN